MLIPFDCSICGHTFDVGDDRAGSVVRCPHCGTSNRIPWNHGAPLPAAVPPPAPPRPGPGPDNEAPLPLPPKDEAGQTSGGKRKMTLRALLIGITALLTFLCIPCGLGGWWFFRSGSLGSEQKYLPSKTQVVYSIQVEKAINSDLVKQVRSNSKDDPFDDKGIEKRFGLPLSNIERMTFAGSTTDSREIVMILRTRQVVKAADIKSTLGNSKFEGITVGKFTIYQASDDSQESFCVAEDKVVVFGPFITLQGIMQRGKKPELPEAMQTALDKADFSTTFAFAINVKDIRKETEGDKKNGTSPVTKLARDLAGLMSKDNSKEQAELLENQFANVETLSGSMNIKSDVTATCTAVCKNSSSCEDLKKILEAGLVLARNNKKGEDDPRETALKDSFLELCNTARFSHSGNALTVTFTLQGDPLIRLSKTVDGGLEDAKVARARIGARDLVHQANFYTIKHRHPPLDIQALTLPQPNGEAPLLAPDKILDPWQKPYQLEIDQRGDLVVFTIAPNGIRISSADKQ